MAGCLHAGADQVTDKQDSQDDHALRALLCACLRFDADASLAGDLRRRVGSMGWDHFLAYADTQRLGSVLVRAIARLGVAPAVPPLTLPNGRVTITRALAQREADHLARRLVLHERLEEIAKALNRNGIVPIALKGGRTLVTGQQDWRHLRDIDLLVRPHQAARAQEIVLSLGYRPSATPLVRHGHHHLNELYRDDLPGWIEIHRRGGPSRVEQFLPSAELIASATSTTGIGVLPRHLHVLHGVIHHHVGHGAVKRAVIGLKGLYEFAADVMGMSENERGALAARAARHPRVLAIIELWTVAAADLFGTPATSPLRVAEDATLWWASMRDGGGARPTGIGPEWRAATSPERMRRASGGERATRRLYWRLTMLLTFVNRPNLSVLDWRRGPAP